MRERSADAGARAQLLARMDVIEARKRVDAASDTRAALVRVAANEPDPYDAHCCGILCCGYPTCLHSDHFDEDS